MSDNVGTSAAVSSDYEFIKDSNNIKRVQQIPLCLSIDVGSVNCGVCLFDAENNTILLWNVVKVAASMVRYDGHGKRAKMDNRVQDIAGNLCTLFDEVDEKRKGQTFWVVIEDQPEDRQSRQHRLPNITLSYTIGVAIYSRYPDVYVHFVNAKGRYTYLGPTSQKHDVKLAVQAWVDDAKNVAHQYPQHNYAINAWDTTEELKREHIADAFLQIWPLYYRNKDDAIHSHTSQQAIDRYKATEAANLEERRKAWMEIQAPKARKVRAPPLEQQLPAAARQNGDFNPENLTQITTYIPRMHHAHYGKLPQNLSTAFKKLAKNPKLHEHLKRFVEHVCSETNHKKITSTNIKYLQTLEKLPRGAGGKQRYDNLMKRLNHLEQKAREKSMEHRPK